MVTPFGCTASNLLQSPTWFDAVARRWNHKGHRYVPLSYGQSGTVFHRRSSGGHCGPKRNAACSAVAFVSLRNVGLLLLLFGCFPDINYKGVQVPVILNNWLITGRFGYEWTIAEGPVIEDYFLKDQTVDQKTTESVVKTTENQMIDQFLEDQTVKN